MSNLSIERPAASEYAPYYEKYVSLVPNASILSTLDEQIDKTVDFLSALSETKAASRYEPGKWSIKEVIGHLIDTEQIFGYRALCFARNDPTPIPGFDQDSYVREGQFDSYHLSDLASQFQHVRRANILFFKGLTNEAWLRRGTANDNEVSVRGLAFIMAGHESHHISIIRTRYL